MANLEVQTRLWWCIVGAPVVDGAYLAWGKLMGNYVGQMGRLGA
jgi:hypothetical protein